MSFLNVLLLSLIEGITEFIPVSSTGHLIVANAFLKIQPSDFTKAFDVIIQFGAILAVLLLYRRKLKWDYIFYRNITLAFIPTAILGFIFKNKIDILLESTTIVAVSLIIGGIIMIVVDSLLNGKPENELSPKSSVAIGIFQSLAMIPGVSRSAATIVGGQVFGLTRENAAEFSFLLAVPTMAAATLYKLWKIRHILDSSQTVSLSLGVLFSFIFAVFAIKFFISMVHKYGFKYFGYYRILIGVLVLFLMHQGVL